jgi:hypothetical protein
MMTGFERTLRSEIDAAPVVDPHTHLRPSRPQADGLADILLYHHVWVELVAAGLPATAATKAGLPHELADPKMEPIDRARAVLPYLGNIRNTTCGSLLRTLLGDLYGVPAGELTEGNLEDVFALAAQRAQDPAWGPHVLRDRCHIVSSLTVERNGEPCCDEHIGRGIEQNVNLISGKSAPQQALEAMEHDLGRELRRAEDLGAALHALGQEYSQGHLHFVGLWLLPHLSYEEATEVAVTRVIERARDGNRLSHSELSAFTCYALRSLLSGLETGPLRTIQAIVGAEVLPPHRSLTHWSPEFPGSLARLAGEFEGFQFNCSAASDLYTQDLAILAKHVPNISVAGYWWHTLYPSYIRKSIETRLDIVPANKIVAFFSDAYHAEWCYPKVKLVKRIFGDVLLDRVAQGLLTDGIALSLVRQVFFDNPERIYGVG